MSKSNRIKGKFSEMLGCRVSSPLRCADLESRTQPVPTESQNVSAKVTMNKAARRSLKKMMNVGDKECHPLARKATMQERGYAKILSLASRVFTTPEGKLYDKTTS